MIVHFNRSSLTCHTKTSITIWCRPCYKKYGNSFISVISWVKDLLGIGPFKWIVVVPLKVNYGEMFNLSEKIHVVWHNLHRQHTKTPKKAQTVISLMFNYLWKLVKNQVHLRPTINRILNLACYILAYVCIWSSK